MVKWTAMALNNHKTARLENTYSVKTKIHDMDWIVASESNWHILNLVGGSKTCGVVVPKCNGSYLE